MHIFMHFVSLYSTVSAILPAEGVLSCVGVKLAS